jgi:uncharacterized protein (TIGR02391 family)
LTALVGGGFHGPAQADTQYSLSSAFSGWNDAANRDIAMATLRELIPDPEMMLSLAPEELGFYLLRAIRDDLQGMDRPICYLLKTLNTLEGYAPHATADIQIAVTEAWGWLENQLYLVPAPGVIGAGGVPMRTLGRRAKALTNDESQWRALRAAAAFPKELLHPMIAERAWISLARAEFDAAVFFAFRTVEEAVRSAGGFAATDIGVALMRKAFDPQQGPLTDKSQPLAERDALSSLFAGAMGSYKNPHSHRTVTIIDHSEAQEVVMLASHLLRIIDARSRVSTLHSPSAAELQR